jgi:hypothetical protein
MPSPGWPNQLAPRASLVLNLASASVRIATNTLSALGCQERPGLPSIYVMVARGCALRGSTLTNSTKLACKPVMIEA